MGFYNVSRATSPTQVARRQYAISDNYHQSVKGGTGANHIALGTGDAIWYSDGKGTPPRRRRTRSRTRSAARHQQLVHAGRLLPAAPTASAPTERSPASAVVDYLRRCRTRRIRTARPGTTTCSTTTTPAIYGDGTVDTEDRSPSRRRRCPRSATSSSSRHLVGATYGEGWNTYVADPTARLADQQLLQHLQSLQYTQLDHDQRRPCAPRTSRTRPTSTPTSDGALPAVSFVKPSGLLDGHPASSKLGPLRGLHEEDHRRRAGPTRSSGPTRRSSSPSTRAAATGTRATSSRSTSSATARASR